MKKYIAMSFVFALMASAEAADVFISCKVVPAMVKDAKESDAIEGLYTIVDGGTKVKIGTSDRTLPLSTNGRKYEWQWTATRDGTKLTVREEINRVTGQYAMYIDGPRGSMHASSGVCSKAEPKL